MNEILFRQYSMLPLQCFQMRVLIARKVLPEIYLSYQFYLSEYDENWHSECHNLLEFQRVKCTQLFQGTTIDLPILNVH